MLNKLKNKLQSIRDKANSSNNNRERSSQAGEGARSSYVRTVKERQNIVTNYLNKKRISLKKYIKGELKSLIE